MVTTLSGSAFCLFSSFSLTTDGFSLLKWNRQLLTFMLITSQSERESSSLPGPDTEIYGEGSYRTCLGPPCDQRNGRLIFVAILGQVIVARGISYLVLIRTIGYAVKRAVSKALAEGVLVSEGGRVDVCVLL